MFLLKTTRTDLKHALEIFVTNWASLRDAYGSAAAVEGLLERADTGDRAVWDEMWSRLCHQGTVYAASYAALPQLAELAARLGPPAGVEPLFLATCIVASTGGPEKPAAVRARYAGTVRALNEVAETLLAYASEDTDFVYRLQALVVTDSDTAWATHLDALANKELEFACPGCDEAASRRVRNVARVCHAVCVGGARKLNTFGGEK